MILRSSGYERINRLGVTDQEIGKEPAFSQDLHNEFDSRRVLEQSCKVRRMGMQRVNVAVERNERPAWFGRLQELFHKERRQTFQEMTPFLGFNFAVRRSHEIFQNRK